MTARPRLRAAPLFLLLLAAGLFAQIPPAPTQYVTDRVGFLSANTREELESKLAEFERRSGNQFIIFITDTSGDLPPEDWSVQAFQSWGIGKKGVENGIALFIFARDRKLRIEVGYGLEGQVPDITASHIIRDAITPRLQEGANDDAVRSGADAIMATVTGEAASEGEKGSPAAKKLTPLQALIIGLIVIGFLLLLITNPSLAIYLLFSILSGGRGGGGGGFRGGGGRSGGGGASGSW